jgi:hypothetical protein
MLGLMASAVQSHLDEQAMSRLRLENLIAAFIETKVCADRVYENDNYSPFHDTI